jgi:hypothetical protein
MKLDGKLRLYSITNEIKWAFLWVNIAHVAQVNGDEDCGTHAQERGNAAYRKATQLLDQADTDDEQLRAIKSDLETLRIALGSHAPSPAASLRTAASPERSR